MKMIDSLRKRMAEQQQRRELEQALARCGSPGAHADRLMAAQKMADQKSTKASM
ncbi:hypothetical protein ACFQ78_28360 [Streptomyces sp. NPDC056519]|uniref:hypothetical protein n=1 Tax=Streptomyces sp. NPDC056519 TaxID=3345849 RepID=UPI003697029B